jgi:hypothetical protein
MGREGATTGIDTSDLSAWLDGELDDDAAALLEEQLALDPTLKAELDELEAVVAFVRERAPVHAPDGFTARLLDRVDAEEDRRARGWRRPFGVPWEGWAAGLAAAAAILLVAWPRDRSAVRGDEQLWSPAALEGPRAVEAPVDPVLPPPADAKGAGGSGRRGTPRVVETTPALEVPPVEVVPPDTAEASEPLVTAPPPPLVYTVQSVDPELKRRVLAIVARYGFVITEDGEPVAMATMDGPRERLLVSIAQDSLPEFDRELQENGYAVSHRATGTLVNGDRVEIEIQLELLVQ